MTGLQIIAHNTGGGGGAGFTMIDDASNAEWKFKTNYEGDFKVRDQINSKDVLVIEQNTVQNALYVRQDGNIGLGTDNPTSKLAVNGKIDCKEVEIFLTGWSDHVFDEDYELQSLDEIEAFVKENKHLPGVPSEKEVIEKGVNVGEMNAILLEKIEELTLHLIELKKENEEVKKQLEDLKK